MFRRSSVTAAVMTCLAVCSTLAAPASSLAAQARAAGDVAGTWAGSFANTEWTFEFRRAGNTWTGRYMSAREKAWSPMQSLSVSAQTVQFSLDSKPPVIFNLKVDPTNKVLAGQVNVFNRKLPFSAARRS